MTIPELSTADKSFVCSYSIGANVNHRLALGIINKITIFTSEYVEGECWIPVNASITDNNHSWYWDLPEKDVVYVNVGVRASADGYVHSWLMNTQSISELILWNNNHDETYQPPDDATVLHLVIERVYRMIFGNTTGFVSGNIKFQKYVGSGATRLYLFGNYSNSLSNPIKYTINHPSNVQVSSMSWYPNNYSTARGDILYAKSHDWSKSCNITTTSHDMVYSPATAVSTWDGTSYADHTSVFNGTGAGTIDIFPAVMKVNDATYFGYSKKSTGVRINILQGSGDPGGSVTKWEYWDGTEWKSTGTSGDHNFSGTGETLITYAFREDAVSCTVNGTSAYWVRVRIDELGLERNPIGTIGEIRHPDYWIDFAQTFGKSPDQPEPIFYLSVGGKDGSTSIPSVCNPTDPTFKYVSCCMRPSRMTLPVGNNSGRSYPISESSNPCPSVGYTDCGPGVSVAGFTINYTDNRAYIWVPGHCSGASGGTQSECETNGGTWVPGHYTCDPAFTYDSSVSWTHTGWDSASMGTIDYANGEAQLNNVPTGRDYLAVYYWGGNFDRFNEVDGDLDELKHVNFTVTKTGAYTDEIYTIYTKHVGIGLLTNAAATIDDSDWVVNWGAADYFSNWQNPDGLSARIPPVTNVIYDRPLTHHDEFYTGDTEVTGGFLTLLSTSVGFNGRAIGSQVLCPNPVCDAEFDHLYELLTSDGFSGRTVGEQALIDHPVCVAEFDHLYGLLTSDAFIGRNITEEDMLEHPVCLAEFCWWYELIEPSIAKRKFVKNGGDDTLDGGTWLAAWEHWNHAMANISEDTVLYVAEGTYAEPEVGMSITKSGEIYPISATGTDEPATITLTPT